MPRLRTPEGVVINVSDEKAARLGDGFVPVEDEKPKAAAKKASSRKSEK